MTEAPLLASGDIYDGRKVYLLENPTRSQIQNLAKAEEQALVVMWKRGQVDMTGLRQDVRSFTWHTFPHKERFVCHDWARGSLESVYKTAEKSFRLLTYLPTATRQVVERATKKLLLLRLFEMYSLQHAGDLMAERGCDVKIIYTPQTFDTLNLALKTPASARPNEASNLQRKADCIPPTFLTMIIWRAMGRLKLVAKMNYYVLRALACVRKVTCRSQPKKISLALNVEGRHFGFSANPYQLQSDWMVTENAILPGDVLVVATKDIPEDWVKEVSRRGYRQVDWRNFNGYAQTDLGQIAKLLFLFFGAGPILLIASLFVPEIFATCISASYREFIRWSNFIRLWRPICFLTYNDAWIDIYARNSILRSAGIACDRYQHSGSSPALYATEGQYVGRHVRECYLDFDIEFHWHEQQRILWSLPDTYSKEVVAAGCPWVVSSDSFCPGEIESKLQASDTNVVLFLSSFGPDANNYEKDQIKFLRRVVESPYWDRFDSPHFIVKPKSQFSRMSESHRNEMFHFVNHAPRNVTLIEYNELSASPLLARVDICISMPFESPTVEALCNGLPGFFFDAQERFPGSYFTKFEGLVASGDGQFEACLENWLSMSRAGVREYWERNLEPAFGVPYRNDMASVIQARIRALGQGPDVKKMRAA